MFSRFLFLGAVFALIGCQRDAPKQDVMLIASDMHVIIAGKPLTLPLVAMQDYAYRPKSFSLARIADRKKATGRSAAFIRAAGNVRSAPRLDSLTVVVRTYGWDDSDPEAHGICPRLTSQWSKSVCENPWAALQQALPRDPFKIVDLETLKSSDRGRLLNCADWSKREIPLPVLKLDMPTVVCKAEVLGSGETKFFTAAIRINGDVGAIWTVWQGGNSREVPEVIAKREGQAIAAFVRDAIGPEESFGALHALACSLRRPNSADGPEGPDCE